MFDDEAGPAQPGGVLLVDHDPFEAPELTEADYQRLFAAQLAADPGDPDADLFLDGPVQDSAVRDRRAWAAQVIQVAQTAPITDFLISQLSTIDVTDLDEDLQIGSAVAWTRIGNYVQARRGEVIAAVARTARPVLDLHPLAAAAGEIGAALALGSGAASTLVDSSLLLADRLP